MNNNEKEMEHILFLYYYVFSTPEAKELLELWVNDILNTSHFQPQLDPNNTKTIRDMGVLEFIQGIRNRVNEFIEKGVKDGPTNESNTEQPINTASQPANRGTDTGQPDL